MITESMNTNEVLRELQKDEEFVSARRNGLLAKNNKKLKNKFIKNGDIMSVSNYVVPETKDTVVVFAVKEVEEIHGRGYVAMRTSSYVKTYYGTYITYGANNGSRWPNSIYVFTRHFVARLKERLGKDFMTFFKEDFLEKNNACISPIEYKYGGKENTLIAHIGDAFVIIAKEDSGKKYTAITVLSENELYSNQLVDKKESEGNMERFKKERNRGRATYDGYNLRELRSSGDLRKASCRI